MELLDRLKLSTVKILSVDGGGIRGIVPALILVRIEEILHRLNKNKFLYEVFHLMAGTSTGGLVALSLSTPRGGLSRKRRVEPLLNSDGLVRFYREKGAAIFPAKSNKVLNKFIHAFKNKFKADCLEEILNDMYKGATLKEALTNVLITSYDTENREPLFFKNRPEASEWGADQNFYLRDVARATVAAPTYFPPAYIKSVPDDGTAYSLIDGGICANNPALNAYVEARKIYPNAKRYLIVSLGTGVVDKPYAYEEVKNWGYIDWMSAIKGLPLLDMMMDGQSDGVIHMLKRMPGAELHRYDFRLDEGHTFMDDASPGNMEYLERKAGEMLAENEKSLVKLCKKL